MSIEIIETENKEFPKFKPIKEKFDVFIPGVQECIPNRNGFVYVMSGSGGSGKTSLLLNMFKSNKLYRCKFDNIFYICPMSSFLSVEKHPFLGHDKVYHDLTVGLLEEIRMQLDEIKQNEDLNEYSCVIIDDMASTLKDIDISNKLSEILVKTRHYKCSFIFTLQSYFYFPKILRKQITNITIYKTKNIEEWNSIAKELLNMNNEDGLCLFNYVFDKPYNHLDIDCTLNKYYKNFNPLEIIKL